MTSNGDSGDLNLSSLFDKLLENREELENSTLSSSSEQTQATVAKSVELCHKGIEMINKLSVFSDNENIDEVTTNELKYMLLPALLGYFNDKITVEDRIDVVPKCRECYVNFLKLCRLYNLTNYKTETNLEDGDGSSAKSSSKSLNSTPIELVKADAVKRQEKINRFKSVKKLEGELEKLYKEVKKEHVDEEVKREYYLKLINKWIYTAIDTVESLDNELPLLEHMKKLKSTSLNSTESVLEPCSGHDCHKHSKQKFQPFIITKDPIQKQVFGLGYPSIPTVSVDEFYDQRVQEGLFPNATTTAKKIEPDDEAEEIKREQEAAEKDKNEDDDNEDAVMRARRWDEYRDDHRRGWGNTHNKG